MLKNIDIYIGIVIMMFGIVAFARIILNEPIKVSKTKLLIIVLLTSIIYTFTSLYANLTLKTLINCAIQIVTFKYVFKIEYPKSIILTIIYVLLLLIPEMIVMFLIQLLYKISNIYIYDNIAGNVIGNIAICIIFLPITYFLKKPLRKIVNYKLQNNVKIIIFSILTFICIAIVYYNAFENLTLDFDLVISIFTMIVFITILISLIKQTVENTNITKKYEQTLEFMTTFEDEVEKQRVLRHETKNAFLSIKAQITDKGKEKEIIEYINSILKEDTKMKYEEYAKFKYLPANGIKGLCYYKVQEAENKGINISINISPRLENCFLTKLSVDERKELGKILGVFLDNAIEASINSKEKVLGFEAYMIDKNVKIIISNSYTGTIDTDKIGQERYSTKGKKRGHGLLLVKSILNNNTIFETQTDITEKLYIQNIIIKKPTHNK